MSCCSSTTNGTTTAAPDPAKHVNYSLGMVLGVDDFTQEFAYLSGRDQWMARDLIGYGTVRGLRVMTDVDAIKGARVIVDPGVAVSPGGRMICVPAAQCAYLRDWITDHAAEVGDAAGSPVAASIKLYVVLCYRDCTVDNVPIAGEPCRSEDQLMAPSRIKDDFCLQLRLRAPNQGIASPPDSYDTQLSFQREEDAVRDYVQWIKNIPVIPFGTSTPLDEFLQAIRDAAMAWFASPPVASPPSDFMVGSPPSFLQIESPDLSRYLSAAFRLWVTELRPKWITRWHGCAPTHFDADKEADDDCVLLAELDVPVVPASPGWTIADADIALDETQRPYLIHLRMLQEWLLSGPAAAAPPPAKLINVTGPADLKLSDEQFVICDSTGGTIKLQLPPAASSAGHVITFKRVNTGSNKVTISVSPGDHIDAATQKSLLAQYRYYRVLADGKTWHIIGPA
ncbi:MAG TPA: hypothetical protein VE961_07925 [Pyrinomonadaceae bacterium]|nr:hypothetical protein [Pyrinomonadaceae bacterium]